MKTVILWTAPFVARAGFSTTNSTAAALNPETLDQSPPWDLDAEEGNGSAASESTAPPENSKPPKGVLPHHWKLLDVHGALDVLPVLPLTGGPETEAGDVSATGTDDLSLCSFAPTLAPSADKSGKSRSFPGKMPQDAGQDTEHGTVAVSPCRVNRSEPLSNADNGSTEWATTDLNRRHPWCN